METLKTSAIQRATGDKNKSLSLVTRHLSLVVLFACLGGGFVVPTLHADELSISPSPTNAPPELMFSESDALALLTDSLQRDYVKDKGELELRFIRPWSAQKISNGPVFVKILEVPSTGVAPSFIIRFELRTADTLVGTFTMAAQARIWQEVWVAHTTLKRGDPLADADVVRERRDVLNIRDALADFSDSPAERDSLELAESVQAGAPLLARMLKPRTVLHRGQMADAVVRDGALSINMKVEVLEDGAPGDIIRARNPLSRRNLSGKVLNEQTILISL